MFFEFCLKLFRIYFGCPEQEVLDGRRGRNGISTFCLVEEWNNGFTMSYVGKTLHQFTIRFRPFLQSSKQYQLFEGFVFFLWEAKDADICESECQDLGDGLVQPGLRDEID